VILAGCDLRDVQVRLGAPAEICKAFAIGREAHSGLDIGAAGEPLGFSN